MDQKNPDQALSPFQRLLLWNKKPKITAARAVTDTQILKCRVWQGENFDVCVTISEDRTQLHLKNALKHIDSTHDVGSLFSVAAFGQTRLVSLTVGSITLSIERESLRTALQAFGILCPKSS